MTWTKARKTGAGELDFHLPWEPEAKSRRDRERPERRVKKLEERHRKD
jgi:hypothetical protein